MLSVNAGPVQAAHTPRVSAAGHAELRTIHAPRLYLPLLQEDQGRQLGAGSEDATPQDPADDSDSDSGGEAPDEGSPYPIAEPETPTTIVPDEDGGSEGGSAESPSENPGLTYCDGLAAREMALARLMRQHPAQQRAAMHCDPILTGVARSRAEDMGRRDYVAHQTPEGQGPNELVVAAGYVLPPNYSLAPGSNNIESLAAGSSHVDTVWETWMSLPSHRLHLLADDDFFSQQTRYGIGYAYVPNSRYGHYWVVLTAPPLPSSSAE